MKKNLLARGIEKIGKASAENSANKKLIIMLHEPEVPEKGKVSSGNRRVTSFKTNFTAFRKF